MKDIQNVQPTKGLRYIIKADVDLKGYHIKLAPNSKLIFKNGSLYKGVVEGDNTKIVSPSDNNIFHKCEIQGSWNVKIACSTMFDSDLETILLLKNLSAISSHIQLAANREYFITAKGDRISLETLEAYGTIKPVIHFHTIDPNINGIIIEGHNIQIKNLSIIDDYNVCKDEKFGNNNATIGSTIGLSGEKSLINSLIIDGCDFSGGTSSSYIASADVCRSTVNNCTFTGYICDHAAYFSTNIKSFVVSNCSIYDVFHCGNGLFKVRASDSLDLYCLRNIKAHNLHGYMGMLSLKDTPMLRIQINNITVTKDPNENIFFHGFCVNDESRQMKGKGYNAKELSLNNCLFEYGYRGNSIIYPGNGVPAVIKKISYDNVIANESNFGGGVSDTITVSHSTFKACIGETGIAIKTRHLSIVDTKMISNHYCNSFFLFNYGNDRVESVFLKDAIFSVNATYLAHFNGGESVLFQIQACKISSLMRNVISAPELCNVNYSIDNSEISANKEYKVVTLSK